MPGPVHPLAEPLVIAFPHPTARPPEEADDNRAGNHVQGVQAGQREINRQIRMVPGAVIFHFRNLGAFNVDMLMLRLVSFQIE